MKFSRAVVYAIRATTLLAKFDSLGPVPSSRLAAQGEMPERFLLQILRSMVNSGILSSTRGVDGGYRLVKAPEEINLLEVIESVEGPLKLEASLDKGQNDSASDRLAQVMKKITLSSRQHLQETTLADLMGRGKLPPATGATASDATALK
ncbi:MAG TPA: Rrf2 family transcriptional regulator [Pirellulales bacterium]|nr:Rrf2 family transcriptional regulator [Pirellulales bacterium]